MMEVLLFVIVIQSLIDKVEGDFESLNEHITTFQLGTGGMQSKVNAAKLLFDLGIDSCIANGNFDGIVKQVIANKGGYTYFSAPRQRKLSGVRKVALHWRGTKRRNNC